MELLRALDNTVTLDMAIVRHLDCALIWKPDAQDSLAGVSLGSPFNVMAGSSVQLIAEAATSSL
jgi:hypothetical protein